MGQCSEALGYAPAGMAGKSKDDSIPGGRVQRTAKVGQALGSSGARYAGTRARNVVRSEDKAAAELDKRHLETAERMVDALGQLKGAAMKIGQLASFIDTEFLPPEYRELYQDKLAALRSEAPTMKWKDVRKVLDEEWRTPSRSCSRTSSTTPPRPPRSARCTARRCPTADVWR